MKSKILKYALQNAIKFKGKANPGAIIGKLMQEDPSIKSRMEEINSEIQIVINDISLLSVEEQTAKLREIAPELLEKAEKQESKGLKELPNVGKKVRMRFEPSPSGPLHIGHAYVISLNYEYCKKYKGEFFLRVGDTNPGNIYPEAYNLIPEDGNWLTENSIKQVIIQSDRVLTYYEYAEKLFQDGKVYVCNCDTEEFRDLIKKSIQCPCRYLDHDKQLRRWHDMTTVTEAGSAVVRFKSNLEDRNPAMRDFPLFRITELSHARVGKKYRVWPLMNFSVAIDDMEMGITHTLRGKEHADNAKRQALIHNALGFKTPEAISVGRIKFEGFEVSCTKTREKIEAGLFEGWEDIRLPFLPALRRRGYQPEALRKFAVEIGVTRNDKVVEMKEFFKTINAFNKEIIDPIADRRYFIWDPVKIKIGNVPALDLNLDLHPDNKKGGRNFTTTDEFFITQEDFDCLEDGELYRLMDCINFVKAKKHFVYDSVEYSKFKSRGKNIMHWLPVENVVDVEVKMDDNTIVKGFGEAGLTSVQVDEVIQLERFGFVRCDSHLKFWFCHR